MSSRNLFNPLRRLWLLILEVHSSYSLLVQLGVPIVPGALYLAAAGGLKLTGLYLGAWSDIFLNALAIGVSFAGAAIWIARANRRSIAPSAIDGGSSAAPPQSIGQSDDATRAAIRKWYHAYAEDALHLSLALLRETGKKITDEMAAGPALQDAKGFIGNDAIRTDTVLKEAISTNNCNILVLRYWLLSYVYVVRYAGHLSALIEGGVKSVDLYARYKKDLEMVRNFRELISLDEFDNDRDSLLRLMNWRTIKFK